ncbi:hypothetical protein Pta02_60390 [Planobispora takensis]|uniref:Uncharacterized protein n=1 Tax=Planobispora takensis TaxID=1367882 RepID=A0A8J3WVR1_9ACTN|nr:hypothetical protein Pta02_60390 [Planobispora takensis]
MFRHDIRRGASVLKEMDRFCARIGEVGHGTQIAGSVRRAYAGHDRVVILSDMQTMSGCHADGVTGAGPAMDGGRTQACRRRGRKGAQ